MSSTQPSPPPVLDRWVRILGVTAGVAILLLVAIVLGSWAMAEPPKKNVDPAKPDADALAAALVVACDEAGDELAKGDLAAAHELLAAAGVTAKNVVEKLGADEDCMSAWILTAPEPAGEPSVWESIGTAWDDFFKASFTAVASAATFIALGWLSLFVLARLLVEIPAMRHLTSDKPSRRAAAVIGWTLLALVPVGAVKAGLWAAGAFGPFVWGLLAVLAIVAVVALAAWLATLRVLRVEVKADNSDDPGKHVTAALITARLRELADESAFVELPTGPLVEGLTADLKDFSTTAWVAALQKIVLFLVGVTPWIASAVVRSEAAATVTVMRNRTTIRTQTVSTAGPGLEPLASPPDGRASTADYLSVLIAAEILFALREGYRREFDKGLAKATNSRSVALQYIAIRWFASQLDTTAATKLLDASTGADPYNELARYSLAYVRNRHATDPAQLIAFGATLDRWIGERQRAGFGFEDELLRAMTVTRAAAARNLAALVFAAKSAPRAKLPKNATTKQKRAASALEKRRAEDLDAAVAALHSSREGLDRLLASAADVSEADRIDLPRLRFLAATLTRARMVLEGRRSAASLATDLDTALARALVKTRADVAGAEKARNRARAKRARIDLALGALAEDSTTQAERDALLARRAAADRAIRWAEALLEDPSEFSHAITAIRLALKDDLFTSDPVLAYSLATELVCWERQPLIGSSDVDRAMRAAVPVPVYAEFAVIDPELAAAVDYATWKKQRAKGATVAAAAAAGKKKPAPEKATKPA